jgi:tripartite-type tricarboxylate transporter receptor subunit TctC
MTRIARLVFVITLAAAGAAAAQGYPTKPVRMIVPFPAAGGTDILARIVVPRLSEGLGQQVVVDNRPGAGGTLGSKLAADAPADGYTIIMGTTSTHAIGPHLYSRPPYDPVRDFATITQVATSPTVLMVTAALPAQSLKELIALAKARPGTLNFGSSGVGTQFHLSGELLKLLAGIDIVHIPYKGTALVYPDLFSGQVSLLFDLPSVALPHIKSGRIRALGVTGARRSQAMPDIPTIAEAGVPGYDADLWLGLWGPAKLEPAIASRLHAEVAKVLRQPDVRERLAGQGMEPVASTPAEYRAFVLRENEKWSKVVKAAGVKAE